MNPADPRKKRLVRIVVVAFIAFLLGLIPPSVRVVQLNRELAAEREKSGQAQARIEIAQTRELAAITYIEASRNNFGIAAQHASRLFERLSSTAQTGAAALRPAANAALARRDELMGMLATADPAARQHLQDLAHTLLITGGDAAQTSR
jgi:hypothetical protein